MFFFFQAEDGIRDRTVTGIQTCALPIFARALHAKPLRLPEGGRALYHAAANFSGAFVIALIQEAVALWGKLGIAEARSEERRVGKEWRGGWGGGGGEGRGRGRGGVVRGR